MIALADARPPGLNVLFRPVNTLTVELDWPAGELAGRTFTSDLGGDALDVDVAGDTMTIVAPAELTAAVARAAPWRLVETTGAGDEVVLQGTWTPSTSPQASSVLTGLRVTTAGVTVTVTVTSGQASIVALAGRVDATEADVAAIEADLTTHEAASPVGASAVHGVVEHRWSQSGWAPFTRHVVNQDGAQAFGLTVEGGYGRVTGLGAGAGNQREMYTHAGMVGTDGEITVVFKGPSTYVAGNRPQMGALLRYQEIDGFHVGFVVWYDIFGGNPRILNLSGWRGNGGATLNQAAGGQYAAEVSRDLRIVAGLRLNFLGSWINELTCIPPHLHGLAAGDTVTIDCDDDTFDATAVAVSNADREKASLQYAEPTTLSAVTNKVANGTVVQAVDAKRYFPYVLKARLIGAELSVKAWRGRYEAEPADWQSRVTVATDADFPQLPAGPGQFGVIAAHAHDGSYAEFGDITFCRL